MKKSPQIRIEKLIIKNYKNVEYGELSFCDHKKKDQSDILAVYGPNGSGKSSFIDSMAIIMSLMSGKSVSNHFVNKIKNGADFSEFEVVFSLKYFNKENECFEERELVYSFCLKRNEESDVETNEKANSEKITMAIDKKTKVRKANICNEIVSIKWGDAKKRHIIFDTSLSSDRTVVPATKLREMIGDDKGFNNRMEQYIRKMYIETREDKDRSYVFGELVKELKKTPKDSIYLETLNEVIEYAKNSLFVIGSNVNGLIRIGEFGLPIYMRKTWVLLDPKHSREISDNELQIIKNELEKINKVLKAIAPGLSLAIKDHSKCENKNGKIKNKIRLSVLKNGNEIMIRNEAFGLLKIASVASLLTAIMNDNSVTVVIDELDAGIFEALLIKILEAIKTKGKGQLIFTAHNLSALEVLDRKSVVFTTTGKDKDSEGNDIVINRYKGLKNLSKTHNLRSAYLREVSENRGVYQDVNINDVINAMIENDDNE